MQSLESRPQVHVKTSGGPTVAGYGAAATLSTGHSGRRAHGVSRDADSHLTSQAAEGLKEAMGGERPLGSTVGLRALDDCPTPRVDHKAGGH